MNSECIIFSRRRWRAALGGPRSEEIGRDTARLMEHHRLVLWPFHGIWGAGSSLDETFGMIDTAEKAAEVLVKVLSMETRGRRSPIRNCSSCADSSG
jgi:ribulose-5-phosphate 4-epimerase/fuculose-1-phosphate aldolase